MTSRLPNIGLLRTTRIKQSTDASGNLSVDIKIPGTSGEYELLLKGGVGWFDTAHKDDYVKVSIVDVDGITSSVGKVLEKLWNDSEDSSNQGWYIPYNEKQIRIETLLPEFLEIMSGHYIRVEGKKGDSSQEDFRINIIWGSRV